MLFLIDSSAGFHQLEAKMQALQHGIHSLLHCMPPTSPFHPPQLSNMSSSAAYPSYLHANIDKATSAHNTLTPFYFF